MLPVRPKPTAPILTKPPRLYLRRGRWRWELQPSERGTLGFKSCWLDDYAGHPVTSIHEAYRLATELNEKLGRTTTATRITAVLEAEDRSFGKLIALYKESTAFLFKKRGGAGERSE